MSFHQLLHILALAGQVGGVLYLALEGPKLVARYVRVLREGFLAEDEGQNL